MPGSWISSTDAPLGVQTTERHPKLINRTGTDIEPGEIVVLDLQSRAAETTTYRQGGADSAWTNVVDGAVADADVGIYVVNVSGETIANDRPFKAMLWGDGDVLCCNNLGVNADRGDFFHVSLSVSGNNTVRRGFIPTTSFGDRTGAKWLGFLGDQRATLLGAGAAGLVPCFFHGWFVGLGHVY